jgi:hypothetical protein
MDTTTQNFQLLILFSFSTSGPEKKIPGPIIIDPGMPCCVLVSFTATLVHGDTAPLIRQVF